jgi:hypothetical protein
MKEDVNVFETLNKIDVSKHIEKKNGLSYLSWSWAWSVTKQNFPNTSYKVYENAIGLNYHTDGMTAWVKVGVTINEMECIEYLPVMDFKNKSIQIAAITSMDVNKAIQRALTKAIARHGLGLYIYAGEDLPESTKEAITEEQSKPCTEQQIKIIDDLITFKQVDIAKFLKAYQVFAVNELSFESAKDAITKLTNKK